MAKQRITKDDLGRWATVKWDDTGRVDSLIVEINVHGSGDIMVFQPYDGLHRVSQDQIVEKRGRQNAA